MNRFNAAASTIGRASEIDWGFPIDRQMRLTSPDARDVGSITMASVRSAAGIAAPPHKTDDAFLVRVGVLASDFGSRDLPRGGRGSVDITDLGAFAPSCVARWSHAALFHIPRRVVEAFSDRSDQPRLRGYLCAPETVDPVLAALAEAVLPTLSTDVPRNQRFLDHVDLALQAHLAAVYGLRADGGPSAAKGLSPWQEKRAKELLAGGTQGETSVEDVARACRLSRGHFSKAFRQSTGLSPHAWLLRHRLDTAKRLLSDSHTSVADIALVCGFSDQSHLTRMFSRLTGLPPATWRKQACSAPAGRSAIHC